MTKTRERSFWGWGYADEQLPAESLSSFKSMAQMMLGVPQLEEIAPPNLDDLQLRTSRFTLPPALQSFCTDMAYDRASHCYGKSYRDIMRALYGQFDNPPDYVAYPKTETQIQQLFDFCVAESIALIPYGGGSSVVGGVEPTRVTAWNRPGCSCVLRRRARPDTSNCSTVCPTRKLIGRSRFPSTVSLSRRR